VNSWFPPAAKPKPVENGIKARSKRGAIAQTWWSERFIEVLESIVVGGRLQRGRTYARKGQVIDLTIETSKVMATVQGSRDEPYRVHVGLTAFEPGDWARVDEVLAGDAWFAARLLAGEMPADIEDVFTSLGMSLFPSSADDLSMSCSCPDWSVPCKHLAAVFYLLAEAFDDDPFAILAWRGRERDDLLDALSALRNSGAVDSGGGGTPSRSGMPAAGAVPLTECLDSYYAAPAPLPRRTPVPAPADAVLDQLPAIDVTVRDVHVVDLLRPAYRTLGGSEPTGPDHG
jgi:uncharacterized Zn finger protein